MKKNNYYNKIKKARKKADKLFQEIGLYLTPKCECCGRPATEIHHFIPKSLSTYLRYDLENGISLCRSCHFAHHSKYDPEIYEKMTANKSPEWFAHIKSKRQEFVKPTLAWYESKILTLTK